MNVTTNSDAPAFLIAPRVDIYESAADTLIEAELPGVVEADVSVKVDRGELILEASRSIDTSKLSYRRAFTLPKGVDTNSITAQLERGVLRVHVPRQPVEGPRRIEVRAS